LDKWTKLLEEGRQVDVIYRDFEKAFGKVPHKRLLSKIRSYDVGENLTSGYATWFTAGSVISIAHYEVIYDVITRKL